MKENKEAPRLKKHIFVCTRCTNYKQADNQPYAEELRTELYEELSTKFDRAEVKVTKSGCLGQCKEGVNVVCYPEAKWFKNISKETIRDFIQYIKTST